MKRPNRCQWTVTSDIYFYSSVLYGALTDAGIDFHRPRVCHVHHHIQNPQ